ncbi:unnamed protein product [Clonostachys rhizophaga]|uniref:VOC domain-containing protein n=1 Tax=Clonostachys rhizophaga TaxID=160324 RepID=A0A9N9VN41_9HYPO|nr:unnamed protein product [Clonostachys rhizophaga]
MPLDHVSLLVPESDVASALELYLAALAPLGYGIRLQFGPTVTGLGPANTDESPDFWIIGVDNPPNRPSHIAFRAKDRASVDAFHAAALKAGAKDNGAPGIRAHYHPDYYGAFVLDAAGNNIEAVCHSPS